MYVYCTLFSKIFIPLTPETNSIGLQSLVFMGIWGFFFPFKDDMMQWLGHVSSLLR